MVIQNIVMLPGRCFMAIHCNASREMFDNNTEYFNVSQEMFEVQSKPNN